MDYSQELMDLQIAWQRLIRERSVARQGTVIRSGLDNLYFKALPLIDAITRAVSDEEISNLVQKARQLLSEGAVIRSA